MHIINTIIINTYYQYRVSHDLLVGSHQFLVGFHIFLVRSQNFLVQLY